VLIAILILPSLPVKYPKCLEIWLGVEDSFNNQFCLTYAWILENKGLVEAKIKRIKCLIGK
jgi:hypothetical protein